MDLRILFVVIVGVVSAILAKKLIKVEIERNKGRNEAMKESQLSGVYCTYPALECQGPDVWAKRRPTLTLCRTNCNKNPKCLSIFFDKDKICHLRERVCTEAEMVPAEGGHTLMRMTFDQTCPKNNAWEMAIQYSEWFCLAPAKRCPKYDLYPKPRSIPDFYTCLKKCAKNKSCAGTDFKDGMCYLKEKYCKDEELVDDAENNNYIRLREGVDECPENRQIATPTPEPTEPATTPAPPNPHIPPPALAVPEGCPGNCNTENESEMETCPEVDLAIPSQSSTSSAGGIIGHAYRAVDGQSDGSCSATANQASPWFTIDFGCLKTIENVKVSGQGISEFDITVTKAQPPCGFNQGQVCAGETNAFSDGKVYRCEEKLAGRYLSIRLRENDTERALNLCELQYNVDQ